MCISQQLRSLTGWIIDQLTFKMFSKGASKDRYHVSDRYVCAYLLGDTGYTFVLDAAWYDVFEPPEINVTIERETMGSDIAAAMDAYCANLAIADPNSSVWRSYGLNAEFGAHSYYRMFHLMYIPFNTCTELFQIEYRISHQLTGPMKGNKPATIRLPEIRAKALQFFLVCLCVCSSSYSHRVHRFML